ncbi:calcium-translocating P-type ATPase, PMCA-type [Spizellomyces punctatus DAOM BR117]|uniref:Calcium-transporting ATPase 2 n=1 Tax=Spizellomyces punctatus (strain DAOM BR117) TaxID=645134 RepID=A0A0L0HI84_SPIPD|nr:calcium-translocating P-type ATPase, PMCA-type [Spizellomyces punctatus DAOM BR117]KND00565.1 calcium-translocating P-type ATPase, PMCA-type [Spizellomyces punctatus DAOM BR117]|eukprot:XP_016608604.1 calcium-translocating P-type ATPase, PMCA-type [Spizellomyces punctatus DAOM BR117]
MARPRSSDYHPVRTSSDSNDQSSGITDKLAAVFEDHKNQALLDDLGGVDGVLESLKVDPDKGLDKKDEKSRKEEYGENVLPEAKSKPFCKLMWEALSDKTLILLSIAALISLGIGIWEDYFSGLHDPEEPRVGWVDGAGILVAVLVVVLTNSVNDYQKERQFRKLNAKKSDRKVKVLRSGKEVTIPSTSLVVGDIYLLDSGEILAADCLLVRGSELKVDESSSTGESESTQKKIGEDVVLLSGSRIQEGMGRGVVCCVGQKSVMGSAMMSIRDDDANAATPLQEKLQALAERIAKFGIAAAILMLITLLIKYFVTRQHTPPSQRDKDIPPAVNIVSAIVAIVIQSITIVVVAVPEGLPMAVTIALAYATTRMMTDGNLVRVLSACETMGSATTICSDKTGTLTQNEMTVVRAKIGGVELLPPRKQQRPSEDDHDQHVETNGSPESPTSSGSEGDANQHHSSQHRISHFKERLGDELLSLVTESISINSTAFEEEDADDNSEGTNNERDGDTHSSNDNAQGDHPKDTNKSKNLTFIGSRTDVALLQLARELGTEYTEVREKANIIHKYPFSSQKKCEATLINHDGTQRLYVKGAAECLLGDCTMYLEAQGEAPKPLDEEAREKFRKIMRRYAEDALRIILLAYKDVSGNPPNEKPKHSGNKKDGKANEKKSNKPDEESGETNKKLNTKTDDKPVENENRRQEPGKESNKKRKNKKQKSVKRSSDVKETEKEDANGAVTTKDEAIQTDEEMDDSDNESNSKREKPITKKDQRNGENPSDAQPNQPKTQGKSTEPTEGDQEADMSDLVLIGFVGIEDPLREGVLDAVKKCRKAGVIVRMVTGDNLVTAQAIARKCGIYTRGGLCIEGHDFRELSDDKMQALIPKLQVLARSSPTDKRLLVEWLKKMGQVVAVTGDGTNDAPALHLADVGFSMGSGTEVAKEASDVVMLDDSFISIIKAIMWGRAVNDAVRKFLQFQLTVNITAVLLTFISALLSSENTAVLTTVQLLWVNLIMDTFAALALATDPPTEESLNRRPDKRTASLITFPMYKMIIGQAVVQIIGSLGLLLLGPKLLGLDVDGNDHDKAILQTVCFNAFVFMQLFNEINCRVIDGLSNARRQGRRLSWVWKLWDSFAVPFRGILRNKFFVGVNVGTVLGQVLIVQFGGKVFSTVPLPITLWLFSVAFGSISLIAGLLIRIIPDCCGVPRWERERTVVNPCSQQRMEWDWAIKDVRMSLRVFKALRRVRKDDFGGLKVNKQAAGQEV